MEKLGHFDLIHAPFLGGITRSNYFLVVYRLFKKVVYKVLKSTLKEGEKEKWKNIMLVI